MARKNDSSPHPEDWTTAKLFKRLSALANLETFGGYLPAGYVGNGFPDGKGQDADTIREATRVYRQAWLQPVINELAKRAKVTL